MAEVKLTQEEVAVVRAVLSRVVIRERTGEIGILHGADRFVSSQLLLKAKERKALRAVASKMGLAGIAEAK
jgi:hypothetical protein